MLQCFDAPILRYSDTLMLLCFDAHNSAHDGTLKPRPQTSFFEMDVKPRVGRVQPQCLKLPQDTTFHDEITNKCIFFRNGHHFPQDSRPSWLGDAADSVHNKRLIIDVEIEF